MSEQLKKLQWTALRDFFAASYCSEQITEFQLFLWNGMEDVNLQ